MIFALIIFIFIFSFLIISHELGHFFVAKKAGIEVEEFGIGYPPRIWGKKFGKTLYSINWIPFGGFVKIHGEDLSEESLKDTKSFSLQRPRTKAAVLIAGAAANFLTAVILFYFFLGFNNFSTFQTQLFDYKFPFGQQDNFSAISYVAKDSPAELSGIHPYDLIISANGQRIRSSENLMDFTNEHKGEEVSLVVQNIRSPEQRLIKIVPRTNPPKGQGAMGVGLGDVSRLSYNRPVEKIFSGVLHTLNLGDFSFFALGHLIKVSISQGSIKPLSSSVSGPVGILAFTEMSMAGGFWQIINLMAAIALALSIVNILPIPAADGGRIVFVLYEAIFRKRVPVKFEQKVNTFGFYFLIILLVLVTYKDIIQFKDILF